MHAHHYVPVTFEGFPTEKSFDGLNIWLSSGKPSKMFKFSPSKFCPIWYSIQLSSTALLEYNWFHLIGLTHDCGKVLALLGEP